MTLEQDIKSEEKCNLMLKAWYAKAECHGQWPDERGHTGPHPWHQGV